MGMMTSCLLFASTSWYSPFPTGATIWLKDCHPPDMRVFRPWAIAPVLLPVFVARVSVTVSLHAVWEPSIVFRRSFAPFAVAQVWPETRSRERAPLLDELPSPKMVYEVPGV